MAIIGHVRPYRARTSPDETSEPASQLRLCDIANGVTLPHLLQLLMCNARELQNVDCVEEAVARQRRGAAHSRKGGRRRVRGRSGFREGATMWCIACCESLAVRSTRLGVVGGSEMDSARRGRRSASTAVAVAVLRASQFFAWQTLHPANDTRYVSCPIAITRIIRTR